MTNAKATEFAARPERLPAWSRIARLVRSRSGLAALGAAVLLIGGALNWGWLVAAGIAPVILSLLPCVVMCSLGFCMAGMAKRPSNIPPPANSDPEAKLRGGAPGCAPVSETDPVAIDAPKVTP